MRRNFVVMLVVVLLAAACGGGDDDASELSSASDGATDVQDQSDGVDESDGSDDGDGNGDDGDDAMTGDAGSEWCEAMRAAEDDEDSPLDFDLLGLSPDELEARFKENVTILEDWEAKAPSEIDSQVTTLVDAFRTIVSLADQAEWDLLVLGTDPAFLEAFDSAELEMAADDVDRYSSEVCGVDLGVADAGAGAATTPSVPSAGADGGDVATDFLGMFGLPSNFLTDEQLACVTGELEAAYPDGIPSDLTLNAETVELFDTAGAACGIGAP